MRTMYDSVNPNSIPANANIVAGYVDGLYAWKSWARFPNAIKVRIAVFASTNDGHVLDIETGDATPAQGPGWVIMRRKAGIDPTVYCNASTWSAVRAAFQAAGVAQPHYWIAEYPGNGPVIQAGAIAHQYQDVGPYDLSVVADYWPGIDPGGIVTDPVDTNILGFIAKGGTSVHVRNIAELQAQGIDADSVFGRLCDAQWALTNGLPKLDQILTALANLKTSESKIDADVLGVLSAIQALPKVGPTDAQMQALQAALVKALPGYVINITPTAPTV